MVTFAYLAPLLATCNHSLLLPMRLTIFIKVFCLLFSANLCAQKLNLARYTVQELDSLAKAAEDSAQFDKASLYALASLKKAEEIKDFPDSSYARLQHRAGFFYARLGDVTNSLLHLEKARAIFTKSAPKSLKFAENLYTLGSIYDATGNTTEAERAWVQCLQIRQAVLGKMHEKCATALHRLGDLYAETTRNEQAEAAHREGLEIHLKMQGDTSENYAYSLNKLGVFYLSAGKYAAAEPILQQAVKASKRAYGAQSPLYANNLESMGVLRHSIGDYRSAEHYYLQTLELRRAVLGEEHPHYSATLGNLAALLQAQGENSRAEALLLQSLEIHQRVSGENDPHCAHALNNLGLLYRYTKEYEKSENCYLRAQKIYAARHGEQHEDYARTFGNLADLYFMQNKLQKSEQMHLQALSIKKNILGETHADYISSLVDLGNTYTAMRDFAKAESYYLQSLHLYVSSGIGAQHQKQIATLNGLAEVYALSQRPAQAWDYLLQSMRTNTGIDNLQRDGDWSQAFSSEGLYSFSEASNSLQLAFDLFLQAADIKRAARVCELSLQLLQRQRQRFSIEGDKLQALQRSSEWVARSLQTLDTENEVARAFAVCESNKSVLLLESLSSSENSALAFLPDTLREQERNLQEQYTNLKAALAQERDKQQRDSLQRLFTDINLRIDQFKRQIEQEQPRYAAIKYGQSQPASLLQIQSLLDAETAILEYVLTDSFVYVFFISQAQARLQKIPLLKSDLRQRIDALHSALSDYSMLILDEEAAKKLYTDNALWFYQTLMQPLLGTQKGIRKLLIIPDEGLSHLPFETFLTEAPLADAPYAKYPYLLRRYSIFYNYSASLWRENQSSEQQQHNGELLAFAADYQPKVKTEAERLISELQVRSALHPLPAAREEVEAFSKRFSGKFFFDKEANEHNFKAISARYGIIHLAMHGLLEVQNPLLSSLAFTENGDSIENNFLQAYEIAKMQLHAELVVLSACETGYGKFEHGNGTASLARAFMYAGVPAITVGLWSVNDGCTSTIMQLFYEELYSGKSKADALQSAKLQYLQNANGLAAHPAFWSPFVHIGSDRPISLTPDSYKYRLLLWGAGTLVGAIGLFALFRRLRRKSA